MGSVPSFLWKRNCKDNLPLSRIVNAVCCLFPFRILTVLQKTKESETFLDRFLFSLPWFYSAAEYASKLFFLLLQGCRL